MRALHSQRALGCPPLLFRMSHEIPTRSISPAVADPKTTTKQGKPEKVQAP